MKRMLLAWIAVAATACGPTAIAEQPVSSIPNCAEQEHIAATLDGRSHATVEAAAEEVRQAIIDGGGRPDGLPVEELVQLDALRFYLPISSTPAEDGDGLIEVAELTEGRFQVDHAAFCAGTIPDPFPWGLE
jgi:hypothetical protein